jgi:hypothetical protein
MTHRKPIPLGHWLWIMATVWMTVVIALVRGCG